MKEKTNSKGVCVGATTKSREAFHRKLLDASKGGDGRVEGDINFPGVYE